MVARTTAREAMTQGTINRLNEHGVELAPGVDPQCRRLLHYYQNVIVFIGRGENTTRYPDISAINGGPPFCRNCQHALMPLVEPVATDEEKARGIIPLIC